MRWVAILEEISDRDFFTGDPTCQNGSNLKNFQVSNCGMNSSALVFQVLIIFQRKFIPFFAFCRGT